MAIDADYTVSTATVGQIEAHLRECSDNFVPSLGLRLNISEYSLKIKTNAETFEAWVGGRLAGLVAMYVNGERRTAFITNVSVVNENSGFGLATALIRQAIDFARSRDCTEISLQVDLNNNRAIALYEKFGFRIDGASMTPLSMVLRR